MTLQKIYTQTSIVKPGFTAIQDDTKFEYLLEIPSDQLTILVDLSTPIYEITTSSTSPIVPPIPNTTSLSGILELVATRVDVTPSNIETLVYYAGFDSNSIIFEYVSNPLTTKIALKVGDIINNYIVTKVINRFNHLCYAELVNIPPEITVPPEPIVPNIFTMDTVYSNQNESVSIRVKSGYGILQRAGVIGTFTTNYKEIYYYAKFKIPNSNNINNTVVVDFKNFPVNTSLNNINTPTDYRWNNINSDIINPAQTNQSEIQNYLGGIFSPPNFNIDGTSDLQFPIKIFSFLDIPSKTSELSYGIGNYQPLDNRTDLLGPIELPITINFNRYYQGVPTITPGDSVYDGWLSHNWSFGLEPPIIYTKDSLNYVNKISAVVDNGSNTTEFVLFANNDTLLDTGTHVLDYNTEPYNSSDVTEYYGIQSKYIIPALYTFNVTKLANINTVSTNIEYPITSETRITADFLVNDDVISVTDTSEFLESGYLSIPLYEIIPTMSGTNNESRKYQYYGRGIVSYSGKTPKTFTGVERLDGFTNPVLELDSIEYRNLYPLINQYYF